MHRSAAPSVVDGVADGAGDSLGLCATAPLSVVSSRPTARTPTTNRRIRLPFPVARYQQRVSDHRQVGDNSPCAVTGSWHDFSLESVPRPSGPRSRMAGREEGSFLVPKPVTDPLAVEGIDAAYLYQICLAGRIR